MTTGGADMIKKSFLAECLMISCKAQVKNKTPGPADWSLPTLLIMLLTGAPMRRSSCASISSYPRTAWRRRSDGKAVRTSTVCTRMRRRAHSTRSSPPFAMKAGIHSTLPLRFRRRCRKRSFHSSLIRSWKARCTTEGFIVTRLVRRPTSWEYSSTGARLHLKTSDKKLISLLLQENRSQKKLVMRNVT